MAAIKIYRATNCETGEVITGYSTQLAERFNITVKSLYGYANNGVKANGIWMIDVPENQKELQLGKFYNKDFYKDWESITKHIRGKDEKKKQ